MHFHNRSEAGLALADALEDYRGREDVMLVALPRGGVPVAAEVARILCLPMDVMQVCKLNMPGDDRPALGAIAQGDLYFLDQRLVAQRRISEVQLQRIMTRKQVELQRRRRLYRTVRVRNRRIRTLIVVDDGLQTGATMRVAVAALHQNYADSELVVAVPVGAVDACRDIEPMVQRLVCPYQIPPSGQVRRSYEDFSEVSDGEVLELLKP
jgi:putative phosphoribosyl transferase